MPKPKRNRGAVEAAKIHRLPIAEFYRLLNVLEIDNEHVQECAQKLNEAKIRADKSRQALIEWAKK